MQTITFDSQNMDMDIIINIFTEGAYCTATIIPAAGASTWE